MNKNVGEIIKQRRLKVGMSKVNLARKLGCTPQNVDSLEKRKSIDFEMAQKISLLLDFDLFAYYRMPDPEQETQIADLQRTIAQLTEKYVQVLEKNNELHEKLAKFTGTTDE
jgi:transcriptional regulator with XRE-family HTH domain